MRNFPTKTRLNIPRLDAAVWQLKEGKICFDLKFEQKSGIDAISFYSIGRVEKKLSTKIKILNAKGSKTEF